MKDFIKWLGVNEKIAKLAVWLLIIMIFLIIINTALDSLGLPFYKVTVENLSKINVNKAISYLSTVFISLLNFYSIVFFVLRLKKFKIILPYSIIYIISVVVIGIFFPYIVSQIFILLYISAVTFYLVDNKKNIFIKIIGSFAINTIIQYICYYLYKFKYIGYEYGTGIYKFVTSIDYLIIIFLIIICKEIYCKYRERS